MKALPLAEPPTLGCLGSRGPCQCIKRPGRAPKAVSEPNYRLTCGGNRLWGPGAHQWSDGRTMGYSNDTAGRSGGLYLTEGYFEGELEKEYKSTKS